MITLTIEQFHDLSVALLTGYSGGLLLYFVTKFGLAGVIVGGGLIFVLVVAGAELLQRRKQAAKEQKRKKNLINGTSEPKGYGYSK